MNLQEPKELIADSRKEIKGNLTYDNLTRYSKLLNPNIGGWKKEMVSSLLEMYDFSRNCRFNRNIELETIIKNLTENYRRKINKE